MRQSIRPGLPLSEIGDDGGGSWCPDARDRSTRSRRAPLSFDFPLAGRLWPCVWVQEGGVGRAESGSSSSDEYSERARDLVPPSIWWSRLVLGCVRLGQAGTWAHHRSLLCRLQQLLLLLLIYSTESSSPLPFSHTLIHHHRGNLLLLSKTAVKSMGCAVNHCY
jgi:hypothetical protein